MRVRSLTIGAIVAVALLCLVGTAQAGTISTKDGPGSGNGGEFALDVFTGSYLTPYSLVPTGLDFNTFCVEKTETLSHGITYDYTIAHQAINNGGAGPDPLDEATAKLFYAFWANAWAASDTYANPGYDYVDTTGQRITDATAVQNAIWFLEGEGGSANAYSIWAGDVTWAQLGTTWADGTIGLVRVMNLTDHSGDLDQDLLIVVPLPAAAPAALLLLGGIGMFRRLRRRKS